MKDISTEEILEGIEGNNYFIIQYVYKKFFAIVRNYILTHGGSEEDARDVFQDSIMVIYEQRTNNGLKIEKGFGTYIYTLSRNKWSMLSRKNNGNILESDRGMGYELDQKVWSNEDKEAEELHFKESRARVYQRNFDKLSEECRKMLTMVANGLSIQEIQIRFNYKSIGFAYKKRLKCKNRLIELIKQDKNYGKYENQ